MNASTQPDNPANPKCPSGADQDGFAAFERGDYQAAREIWEARAEAGWAWAQLGMGILYAEGLGVEADARQVTGVKPCLLPPYHCISTGHPLSSDLPGNELGARRRRSKWQGEGRGLAPNVLSDAGVPGAGVFGLLAAEGRGLAQRTDVTGAFDGRLGAVLVLVHGGDADAVVRRDQTVAGAGRRWLQGLLE